MSSWQDDLPKDSTDCTSDWCHTGGRAKSVTFVSCDVFFFLTLGWK